jgi:hypothetical protein
MVDADPSKDEAIRASVEHVIEIFGRKGSVGEGLMKKAIRFHSMGAASAHM